MPPTDVGTQERSPDGRSAERLRAHYQIERELAQRLLQSTRDERQVLYSHLYDELYRRVPDHPQLVGKVNPDDRRRNVEDQLKVLRLFASPDKTMIEIGPGDCALSMRASHLVKRIYGVDVSAEITKRTDLPQNFELILSDGVTVPRPPDGADIVFSNQLMEHLHPADAFDQLHNIVRAMKPGGVYVCLTPNRLTGPHDISRYFSDTAEGFHLKEYSATELLELFQKAGFDRVQIFVRLKGRYFALPAAVVRWLERRLERAGGSERRGMGQHFPYRLLSTICVVASAAVAA
jgi:SAM-dependent methyltransferase